MLKNSYIGDKHGFLIEKAVYKVSRKLKVVMYVMCGVK